MTASTELTPSPSPHPGTNAEAALSETEDTSKYAPPAYSETAEDEGDTSSNRARRRRWLRRASKTSVTSSGQSGTVDLDERDNEEDQHLHRDGDWLVGDDARMGLG